MKMFGRTNDDIETVAEIRWLDETGFWERVGRNIEIVIKSINKQLASPGNDRDTDMFFKGQLRGIERALIEINNIKKNLQKSKGG